MESKTRVKLSDSLIYIIFWAYLKGYSTPKWTFCHYSLTRMSFQLHKSFGSSYEILHTVVYFTLFYVP